MNNEQPIIVGLDIGTTKIAVIAGRKNEFGKLEILGFGKANSNGVKHGQVLNIDETIKAIRTALDNCIASNPTSTLTKYMSVLPVITLKVYKPVVILSGKLQMKRSHNGRLIS